MPSWLCKIWNLLANIVSKVIDLVMGAVKQFLDLAVEALDSLAEALGFSGGTLLLIGLGLAAWWLLSGTDDDDSSGANPALVNFVGGTPRA